MLLEPYVSITGSGPALVLLHGWGLHGGIWQTLLPQLEKHYTVHNVDLPGFGAVQSIMVTMTLII